MRASLVPARKIIEVPDWTVGCVVCGPKESSEGFGSLGDDSMPNRSPQSAGSLTNDHGVAKAINDIAGSDCRVTKKHPVAVVRILTDFERTEDTYVVGLRDSEELWTFVDVMPHMLFFLFLAGVLADFKGRVPWIGGAKEGGYDAG